MRMNTFALILACSILSFLLSKIIIPLARDMPTVASRVLTFLILPFFVAGCFFVICGVVISNKHDAETRNPAP